MRIAVDATCCHNSRGYGRHARSLLQALLRIDRVNRYVLLTDSTERLPMLPPQAELKIVPTSVPTSIAASANGNRSPRDLWNMARALSAAEYDVLLFPTIYSFVPVLSRAKKVVLVHDVIAETYPQLTLPSLKSRAFWKIKSALGRWQADAIVTVSEYSRRAIIRHFGLNADRVFVVGEASDANFRVIDNPKPSARLVSLGIAPRNRSVVYVGGFAPHKNLEMLLAAFASVTRQTEFADVKLVMVGEYKNEIFHSYYRTVAGRVKQLGVVDRVVFTGYLDDEDLAVTLNLATVLVLPSLMEGFGLPAVEAAACGCPVIATTASPLSELLGTAAVYVDPTRQDELERAMATVLDSEGLRQQMRAEGLAAARRLSWDEPARQMTEIFKQVVAP